MGLTTHYSLRSHARKPEKVREQLVPLRDRALDLPADLRLSAVFAYEKHNPRDWQEANQTGTCGRRCTPPHASALGVLPLGPHFEVDLFFALGGKRAGERVL